MPKCAGYGVNWVSAPPGNRAPRSHRSLRPESTASAGSLHRPSDRPCRLCQAGVVGQKYPEASPQCQRRGWLDRIKGAQALRVELTSPIEQRLVDTN